MFSFPSWLVAKTFNRGSGQIFPIYYMTSYIFCIFFLHRATEHRKAWFSTIGILQRVSIFSSISYQFLLNIPPHPLSGSKTILVWGLLYELTPRRFGNLGSTDLFYYLQSCWDIIITIFIAVVEHLKGDYFKQSLLRSLLIHKKGGCHISLHDVWQ